MDVKIDINFASGFHSARLSPLLRIHLGTKLLLRARVLFSSRDVCACLFLKEPQSESAGLLRSRVRRALRRRPTSSSSISTRQRRTSTEWCFLPRAGRLGALCMYVHLHVEAPDLGCVDTYRSETWSMAQHFSRSTSLAHSSTAPTSRIKLRICVFRPVQW